MRDQERAQTHPGLISKSSKSNQPPVEVASTVPAGFFYACNFFQRFFFREKNALVERGRGSETAVRLFGKFGKGPGEGEER